MTTRRFTRFRRGPVPENSDASEVPDNGMCLSVFLILEDPKRDGAVLMGRLDPSAPWFEIGALGGARVSKVSDRWMLPSSQLMLFESPDDAARRIFREQLGSSPVALTGPAVFSDPSVRKGEEDRDPHWDIHFVYRGRWPSSAVPHAAAWKHLEFVDVTRVKSFEIARSQGDVLELAGFQLSP